jgi:hypothetical protein
MAQTKVSLIKDQVIDLSHFKPEHGITTDHIGEGSTRQYFTESRVQNILTTNNYIKTSDVANLETVTSLSINANVLSYTNEAGVTTNIDLSVYLDDSNLARIVSGSLNSGTGVATFTRDDSSTFTVDFSAFLSDANDYVTSASFNTTSGVLTLTRLGGGTVTVDLEGKYSVLGHTHSWSEITEKPTTFAPSSHNHDDSYYTESEVNTFINRSYISNHSAVNLPVGWYTIATNTGDRAVARFAIWDVNSSDHQSVIFYAAHHYGTDASNTITVIDNSYYSGNPFRYIRIKDGGTSDGAALQVYIDDSTNSVYAAIVGDNVQSSGWVLKDWIPDATDPGDLTNYTIFGVRAQVDLNQIAQGGFTTTGPIYADGDTTQYRVFNDNYHPNADILTTARTINGVSFNGSSNITTEPYVERDDATSASRYITFVDDNTAGFKRLNMDTSLSYNPSSNVLTVGSVSGSLSGNASTATTLQTARTINGTSFNGSANITTSNWGTARTLTIGNSGKSVSGGANVSWSLSEIGALPLSGGTMTGMLVIDSTAGSGIAYIDSGGTYIPRPTGGSYKTGTNAITGAIKITFVGDIPDDMFSFWVDIFDYAGGSDGESVSIFISGYAYSNATPWWANCNAVVLSNRTDRDYTVRFGWDGSKHCVTIGETTSTWNYAQINVRDLQAGNSATYTTFDNSMSVGFVTTLPSIGVTASDNYVSARTAKTLQTARTINGTSFNGSANITTANWGTARTLTIGATGKSVSGSGNVSWSLAEIGALGATAKAADSNLLDGLDSSAYLRDDGWNSSPGQNADTQPNMKADFTYANNAPWTGSLISFGAGNYQLQLNSAYNGGGEGFSFRTRNGDTSTWNGWNRIFHDDYHPNADTLTTARTINGTSFNGSANITTANWGTARTINGTSINGSTNYTTANWGTARTIWGQSINGGGNITAPVRPAAGTVTAPAFSTSGDTNTGIYFPAADTFAIGTAGTRRFQIASTGQIGINGDPVTTGEGNSYLRIVGGTQGLKCFSFDGGGLSSVGQINMPANNSGVLIVNNGASGQNAFSFRYGASTFVGRIAINSTTTTYATTSDYRLKENLTEITDGIERLKQLKPRRFNFIGHEEVVDGFVAHEAQEIVPESVTGEKDGVDWEGNPDYQGIDQAKLVPLLTAALQEAVAKIESLESRIQAIEAQ